MDKQGDSRHGVVGQLVVLDVVFAPHQPVAALLLALVLRRGL